MKIEDIATVTDGRILVSVWLESESLGHNLVRPETIRKYMPLAKVLQVGKGVPDWVMNGSWYYISQYAGQIISMEGIDDASREARLICTTQDLLCEFDPAASDFCEKLVA